MDLKTGLLALGFLIAAWTFFRNTRVRRAEWLGQLYETFYVRPELKGVRATLDYDSASRAELLRCLASDPENSVVLEPLVDYLNFFEFIAALWTMNQLSKKEIRLMFGYYLKMLGNEAEVLKFCRQGGFRNLLRLLDRMGYAPSHR